MAKVVTENFKVETTNELYKSFQNENETTVQSFKQSLEAFAASTNTGYQAYTATVDSVPTRTFNTTALIHTSVLVVWNSTLLDANTQYTFTPSTGVVTIDAGVAIAENDTIRIWGLNSTLTDQNINSITALVRTQINDYLPENNYYVMGSSIDKPNGILNSQYEKREFMRRVVFAKKIDTSNIKYMFNRIPWAEGTVYDAFDDATDIETLNMFVTVPDGEQNEGPYKVFKCISNNSGAASTNKPSVNSTDPEIEVELDDGYVWKYMFNIPVSEYAEYSTQSSLPYVEDVRVTNNTKEDISSILIQDTVTALFNGYKPGTMRLESIVAAPGTNRWELEFVVQTDETPRSGRGAYTGMYIHFTQNAKVFDILDSRTPSSAADNKTLFILIESATNPRDLYTPTVSDAVIVPKIAISPSNDATTGVNAIAYGSTDSNGTLNKITFIEKGNGYKYATAKISLPPALQLDYPNAENASTLRVIVSPKGGHGKDPISELAMSRLAFITNFFSDTGSNIPDSGTYTKVGLVKDPTFRDGTFASTVDNRLRLQIVGSSAPNVTVGQYLVEVQTDQTVHARVHQVKQEDGNYVIYCVDYAGDFNANFTVGATLSVKDTLSGNTTETVTINNTSASVQLGNYIPFTGDLLHFVDFDAITRDADRKEKIKFVFDF